MQPVAEADRTADVDAVAESAPDTGDNDIWRHRRKQLKELRAIRETSERTLWWIRAAIAVGVGLFVVQRFV